MNDSPNSGHELPPSFYDRIERTCLEFEGAWKRGQAPRIEEFLAETVGLERSRLLRELLSVELHFRREAGELPSPTEYEDRFPENQPAIELSFEEFRASDWQGLTVGFQKDRTIPESLEPRLPLKAAHSARSYQVLCRLARGGMGEIYKISDFELNRTVAMKVMLEPAEGSGRGLDSEYRARFLEEAQVTAQLDHPGVVPVHELGIDSEGRAYFTMRLVRGKELGEVFDLAVEEKEGWNLPRAVGAVVKACQAVAYAHAKGVIHRDLKPSNIMVGRFGEVYVMDWGLAKVTGRPDLHDLRLSTEESFSAVQSHRHDDAEESPESPILTQDGSLIGTPAYMPPEQADGRIEDIDHRSDLYALGAILYRLLAGHPPYVPSGARVSPRNILARIHHGPPTPIAEIHREAPPELMAICEKAMARDRADRYASSLDLAEDLQAFLDRRVVRAYRTGAVAEFRSWVARNRTSAALGSLAAVLIVVFAGVFAFVERQNALELRSNLAREYLRRGQLLCESGSVSEGLHWFARSLEQCPPGQSEFREVIRENLDGWSPRASAPVAVLPHPEMTNPAEFSSDGRLILTQSYDDVLRVWSVERCVTIAEIPDVEHHKWRLSRDESRVFSTYGWTMRVRSVDTGKLVSTRLESVHIHVSDLDGRLALGHEEGDGLRVWSTETGEALGPALGPIHSPCDITSDGRFVAVASGEGPVSIWRTETWGPPLELDRREGEVGNLRFSHDGKRLVTSSENLVRLWSTETGKPYGKPLVHPGAVDGIRLSADGERIATRSQGIVRVWSVATAELLISPISGIAFGAFDINRDGDRILVASEDHRVVVLPVGTIPSGGRVLDSVHSSYNGATFSPSGDRLLSASVEGAKLFRLDSDQEPITLAHGSWAGEFTPDGERVITAGYDGHLKFWSANSGELLKNLPAHTKAIRALAIKPDGTTLATGSFDGSAAIWSLETGELQEVIPHSRIVEDVAFSPDGQLLATACGDKNARIFSIESRAETVKPLVHRSSVLAVAFSPDGTRIVTGSRDRTARIWDVRTGESLGHVFWHESGVEDVAFSPDGSRLATATSMGQSRIWSVNTAERLGPPFLHEKSINALAFDPSGERLATASSDGTTRLWSCEKSTSNRVPAVLMVEAVTGTRMDEHGVLSWLAPTVYDELRREFENARRAAEP